MDKKVWRPSSLNHPDVDYFSGPACLYCLCSYSQLWWSTFNWPPVSRLDHRARFNMCLPCLHSGLLPQKTAKSIRSLETCRMDVSALGRRPFLSLHAGRCFLCFFFSMAWRLFDVVMPFLQASHRHGDAQGNTATVPKNDSREWEKKAAQWILLLWRKMDAGSLLSRQNVGGKKRAFGAQRHQEREVKSQRRNQGLYWWT